MPLPRLGKIGKTNVGFAVICVLGVSSFVLAKNQVDKQRYENMKSRQRMLQSNTGDYEPVSERNFGTRKIKAD